MNDESTTLVARLRQMGADEAADEIERLNNIAMDAVAKNERQATRLAEAEQLLRRATAKIKATLDSESYYFGGDETIDADIDAFLASQENKP